MLMGMNEVKKLHIIAHSRATDIITTAIRELALQSIVRGENPREYLKIENIILAAPDLDFGIMSQRLIAEGLVVSVGQSTIYRNPNDGALSLSQYILSGLRLGAISVNDLMPYQKNYFTIEELVSCQCKRRE